MTERTEGKWIVDKAPITIRVFETHAIRCSECGGNSCAEIDNVYPNFCQHCGAKMIGRIEGGD